MGGLPPPFFNDVIPNGFGDSWIIRIDPLSWVAISFFVQGKFWLVLNHAMLLKFFWLLELLPRARLLDHGVIGYSFAIRRSVHLTIPSILQSGLFIVTSFASRFVTWRAVISVVDHFERLLSRRQLFLRRVKPLRRRFVHLVFVYTQICVVIVENRIWNKVWRRVFQILCAVSIRTLHYLLVFVSNQRLSERPRESVFDVYAV